MIFLIIMMVVVESSLGIELSYKQLKDIGADCSPEDTCIIPRPIEMDSISKYRCECKSSCLKYDTCCIDSPSIATKKKPATLNGECERIINSDIWTHVVSECNHQWDGDDFFKSKCETPVRNSKDPVKLRPVTSLKSEITYRNYFCAICNDDAENVRSWSIISEEEVEDFLFNEDDESVYVDEFDEWGIEAENRREHDGETVKKFKVYLPSSLVGIVQPCVPNLVSNCNDSWTDETVRSMCHGYMAILKIISEGEDTPRTYRNVHCAICNFQNYTRQNCNILRNKRQVDHTPKRPLPLFLSLLPPVNVSSISSSPISCPKGKVYDHFMKKCRKLICALPGYEVKDGKCVKSA